MAKNLPANAGDPGAIPGSGRSPVEGNGNPLQYFCLEKSMDREAWQAIVHGVTKSGTRLSNHWWAESETKICRKKYVWMSVLTLTPH